LVINPREKALLDYPGPMDLEILNHGEEPTFLPERIQEIIDISSMF
jgi:hypothetical protein